MATQASIFMSMKQWRLLTCAEAKFWWVCLLWHQTCLLRLSPHIGETPGHCGLDRRRRCSLSSYHEQHTQCQSHQGPQGQSRRCSLLGCSVCLWTGCCGLSAHMQGPGIVQAGQSLWLLPGTAEQISDGQSPGLSETKWKARVSESWNRNDLNNPPSNPCISPHHNIFEHGRRLYLCKHTSISLTPGGSF